MVIMTETVGPSSPREDPRITNEAVEAAAKAVSLDWQNFVPGMRAALEAAAPLLAPQPAVDREALIATLHKAGAYCGNCNYEDWELCEDCLKVLGFYADAVLALINGTAK